MTPRIVSRSEWLDARKTHLANEKALTQARDALARERRELPWVKVDKDYAFDTPEGRRSLSDLFAGRSQLMIYHFMFGPNWEHGCPSCSFVADHMDGAMPHLNARDVTLMAVSRAPLARIDAFKARMGWRFAWASSHDSDFNRDFHVFFTPEELAKGEVYYNYATTPYPVEEAHGLSVFAKHDGAVYHTYSSYARGCDVLLGAYHYLDLAPKGRDEDKLAFTMAWVRHHDRYDTGYAVDAKADYAPPKGSGCCAAD